MEQPLTTYERIEQRAQKRRKPGVEYRLRVIKGSDGMLELVEVRPPRHWLDEWARIMPTPWG